MIKSLKRRIANAKQMEKVRRENPEPFRRAAEGYARAREASENAAVAAKSTPAIRLARWFLYALTALILFIIFIGVPLADKPIFSLLSFCLVLALLYLTAGLIQPSIVFFRRRRSRQYALELLGFLCIVIVFFMVVFRP